jgi:hypothetical protein
MERGGRNFAALSSEESTKEVECEFAREKIGFTWAEGSKESAIFMHGGSAARGRWRTNAVSG